MAIINLVFRGLMPCRVLWVWILGGAVSSLILVGHHLSAQTVGRERSGESGAPLRVEVVRRVQGPYVIAPNDVILIKVFQEDQLDTTARVARDGSVSLPMVGSVMVGSRTLTEATAVVASALKEYLVHPQVGIRVLEYSKRRFTVLGQVGRPGIYEMPDDATLSLLEGIGLAGGYSRIANPSRVTVKRSSPSGGEEIFKLDAKQMARSKNAPGFILQAGDTVMVEESLF
ncbi:MAG: polysaccharide biosynthesis/export family protein [Verrucomicrobiota bacterium]